MAVWHSMATNRLDWLRRSYVELKGSVELKFVSLKLPKFQFNKAYFGVTSQVCTQARIHLIRSYKGTDQPKYYRARFFRVIS